MNSDGFSMVQECCDRYEFADQEDGSAVITIEVPAEFRGLWLTRLSDLRATEAEIEEHR